jgi:hypothetical protein
MCPELAITLTAAFKISTGSNTCDNKSVRITLSYGNQINNMRLTEQKT